MSKIFGIKDKRIDKLVCVSKEGTTSEALTGRCKIWNSKVNRVLSDNSNPYVAVEVKVGTKSDVSLKSRPEWITNSTPKKQVKSTKKEKPVETDKSGKIGELIIMYCATCGRQTDVPKGKKCGVQTGVATHNYEQVKTYCSGTKRIIK